MIEPLLALVETRMVEGIGPLTKDANPVCRAALHHLTAGGNRLRARLCLHGCMKFAIQDRDAVTLAAICELLHNASLVQDDLIDRAPSRRNLQSVWAAFDDATAICAGDLMLSVAYALVGELGCIEYLPHVLAVVYRCTRAVILGQGVEQTLCSNDARRV